MTRKEIDKFFANTKVYVAGKSKEIQEKLLSLGYKWNEGNTDVISIGCPFLYIDNNHRISYGSDMVYFSNRGHREITAEEILALELTEPVYRPFNNKDECWQEMIKHQPFGWIFDGNKYYLITSVSDVHIWLGDNACFTFGYAFNKFNFADGTPFGIKEE